ncbi:MAG: DNA/RNA non-specific endonuclease [Bacteroidaceae bacterium]|nr:DNA/RNA non-specific endonuclease [Bacteroidaceae bacterium]
MKNKQRLYTLLVVAICLVVAAIPILKQANAQTSNTETASVDTVMVAESVATPEAMNIATVPQGIDFSLPALRKNSGEQILHRSQMTISYNKEWGEPNWVAYYLTNYDLNGDVGREPEFYQDFEIDEKHRVSTFDYSRSGYDRGHMAPAGDFNNNRKAKKETFYMTNICPQNHTLNANSWNTLEKQCRTWARREKGIYVVVGPIMGKNPKRIGKHNVAVPDGFFRCILSMKPGHEKAIGFIYQNNDQRQRISHAVRSVDEVERITGLDFFTALPDDMEKRLESKPNLKDWGYPKED